jgi:DNA-binding transcriptional MerR regulator
MAPTNPNDARYTLTELADLAGVTPRTVRYYLAQGLLPAVGVAGPGAKYDDGHLARLRLIRQLQREHQPLAEIRRQLESLDDASILALSEPSPAAPAGSALDYIRMISTGTHRVAEEPAASRAYQMEAPLFSALTAAPVFASAPTEPAVPATDLAAEPMPHMERSQWERLTLGPDVELHIRRPLPRSTAKRVDRLVGIARDLLKENLR